MSKFFAPQGVDPTPDFSVAAKPIHERRPPEPDDPVSPPIVFGIYPNKGTVGLNQGVQVRGESFHVRGFQIFIGDYYAVGSTVVNHSLIDGIAPGIIPVGKYPVTVVNSKGRFTLADAYWVMGLISLSVSPISFTVDVGNTRQLTLLGTYSDGSVVDVTSAADWSSDSGNATVSAGLVTGVAGGSANITASFQGLTATSAATVRALVSIQILPANPTISSNATQQFTATAHYSDLSTEDVTAVASWNSSDTTVATIDGAGLATGLP